MLTFQALLQYSVEAVDQKLETTILHPILLITLHMSDMMNLLIANLPEEINAQIATVYCSATPLATPSKLQQPAIFLT